MAISISTMIVIVSSKMQSIEMTAQIYGVGLLMVREICGDG